MLFIYLCESPNKYLKWLLVICRHVLKEKFWVLLEGQDVPSGTKARLEFCFIVSDTDFRESINVTFFSFLHNSLVILPCKMAHGEVWKC